MKKIFITFLSLIMLFSSIYCPVSAKNKKTVDNNKTYYLNCDGCTIKIKSKQNVKWKIKDTKILRTVKKSKKSIVVGNPGLGKIGKTSIIATNSKGQKTKYNIIVCGIEFKNSYNQLYVGDKLKVKGKVIGVNNQSIIWKSSNTAVANVNQRGLVTTKQKGSAVIYAYLKGHKNIFSYYEIDVFSK